MNTLINRLLEEASLLESMNLYASAALVREAAATIGNDTKRIELDIGGALEKLNASPELVKKFEEILFPGNVLVATADYDKLIDDQNMLQALRSVGVDNWDGFDCAMEMLEPDGEES